MKGDYHVYANYAGIPVEVQCRGLKDCSYCQAMERDPFSEKNLLKLVKDLHDMLAQAYNAINPNQLPDPDDVDVLLKRAKEVI